MIPRLPQIDTARARRRRPSHFFAVRNLCQKAFAADHPCFRISPSNEEFPHRYARISSRTLLMYFACCRPRKRIDSPERPIQPTRKLCTITHQRTPIPIPFLDEFLLDRLDPSVHHVGWSDAMRSSARVGQSDVSDPRGRGRSIEMRCAVQVSRDRGLQRVARRYTAVTVIGVFAEADVGGE